MHGYGEFQWPNGQVFRGNYVNDIKEGEGEFQWSNGYIFNGIYCIDFGGRGSSGCNNTDC